MATLSFEEDLFLSAFKVASVVPLSLSPGKRDLIRHLTSLVYIHILLYVEFKLTFLTFKVLSTRSHRPSYPSELLNYHAPRLRSDQWDQLRHQTVFTFRFSPQNSPLVPSPVLNHDDRTAYHFIWPMTYSSLVQEPGTYLIYRLSYSQFCVQISRFFCWQQRLLGRTFNDTIAEPENLFLVQESRNYLLQESSYSQYGAYYSLSVCFLWKRFSLAASYLNW